MKINELRKLSGLPVNESTDVVDNETQFFKTREETEAWLNRMGITNYTIHDNLVVNVNGVVNISNKNLDYIPVRFGKVTGNFNCRFNNLESLSGCPRGVGGYFDCSHNKLKSLKYAPYAANQFDCSNNLLNTLEGAPIHVKYFDCYYNPYLTSLKGAPRRCVSFSCWNCDLRSLEYAPYEVEYTFDCTDNENLPIEAIGQVVDMECNVFYCGYYETEPEHSNIICNRFYWNEK